MTPAQFAEIIARIAKLEGVVDERLATVNRALIALSESIDKAAEPEIGFTPDFHS